MPRRLLTEDQVTTLAAQYSARLAQAITEEWPLSFTTDEAVETLREIIEHDLAVTLEGLMEPEGS